MKEQIQQFRQTQRDRGSKSPKARRILGELSPNKSLNLHPAKPPVTDVSSSSDLQRKYNKLTANYKALEKSRDEYKLKLRQRVEEIDKWAGGVDSRDRLIGSLRKKLALAQSQLEAKCASDIRPQGTGQGVPVDDEPSDVVASVPTRPSPDSSLGQSKDAVPHATASPATSTHACFEPAPPPVISSHPSEEVPQESTDEGDRVDDNIELPVLPEPRDDETRVAIKAELSSDGPVFVSERSVRKRKHGREDEPNDKRLHRIKSEHSSSGPECVGEFHNFAPTESFDFEAEAHIPTPRKRRDLPPGRLQDQDANTYKTTGLGLPEVLRPRHSVSSIAPRTPAQGQLLTPPTYRPSALHDALGRQSRPSTPLHKQPSKERNALNLDIGIGDLADDQGAGSNTIQRHVARGRPDTLLNSPSVRTPTPIVRPGVQKVQFVRYIFADDYEDVLVVPEPRELIDGKKIMTKETVVTPLARQSTINTLSPKATLSRERPPKRPSILREDMPRGRSVDKEKTPFRQKPMDKLRPEDFKPNPRYNEGLTYVYDEVNRGKSAAERAALSGCTDPNCCGKTFRSFAEAERSAAGPSVTTRAEDIKLLEDYLGDEAYKLGTMARAEKEETWLQAKTWELADRFGRHRQRYARVPSPPGFWTVDFPNTQERAEEMRQAEEIRRALVHDRYREAMRPGGRWLFRDEEGH